MENFNFKLRGTRYSFDCLQVSPYNNKLLHVMRAYWIVVYIHCFEYFPNNILLEDT